MIARFLLILALINLAKCNAYPKKNDALNAALERTSNLFQKLKSDHAGSRNFEKDMLATVSQKIVQHIKNISKATSDRHKRESREDSTEEILVLNGFQDFIEFNFDGVQDIKFFSLQDQHETSWFAAALDNSHLSVYKINDAIFHRVGAYPLTNGTQTIVGSCAYGALLIIQMKNESVFILSFNRFQDRYYLQPIQDFETKNTTCLTVWNGMNQLYLAIATRSSISVFTWFGNYFDLIQVIDRGTERVVPFQSKGFMHLAVTGSVTLIFKHSLKSNEFLIVQRLPSSRDVSAFRLREGRFEDHFLALSSESSAIVYKQIHDRFVPFQRIATGTFAVPIVSSKAIVLLTLHGETVTSYQYDGWRFVELKAKLFGIGQLQRVMLHGKQLLLVRSEDGKWTLKEPLWVKKKSYKDLLQEIKTWIIDAKSRARKKAAVEIPNLKRPVKILKGHIDQLYTRNINGHDSRKLKAASKRYKELASKFERQKMIIDNKIRGRNLTVASLRAKRVQVKCKSTCKASRLNVENGANLLHRLTIPNGTSKALRFEQLNVKELENWKCPLLSLPIDDIIVGKSINGISLDHLQRNALKVTGDQVISGQHRFASVNATSASMPLNIAADSTKQEVTIKEARVGELNLTTGGGILLPLNGSPSTITGSIVTPKLKASNIRLQGKITGEWARRLSPTIYVAESMQLDGNFTLENVKLENLNSSDLIVRKTGSVRDTLSNAIRLRDDVPVSLILSSDKVKWSNVTLHGPRNWITANSKDVTIVSGKKHFLRDVRITKSSYDSLKLPRIRTELCAATIVAPEIRTSTLTATSITVKNLTSTRVFGTLGERYFAENSTAASFKPLSSKSVHYRNVTANSVRVAQLDNLNVTELKKLVDLLVPPYILNTSIEATKLVVNTLRSPIRLNEPNQLPKVVRNIIVQQNAQIDIVNNINFPDFLANAIKLDDMISLQNVTFDNGFSADRTYASDLPFSLTNFKEGLNLGKKTISGNVQVAAINLPYSFDITPRDFPVNINVKGSASFQREPTVTSVNDNELEKLFGEVWLASDATEFYGRNLHIEAVIVKGNITLNNPTNTLNPDEWRHISERILSKTKLQEITVNASFDNVEAAVIIGSNTSSIKSSLPDFDYTFENCLMKNGDQIVKGTWTFETINVLGNLHLEGKFNNMDLRSDVMRHDSKENIVTGRKTVAVLTAENLNGYTFDKWANNAVTRNAKQLIIKGRKKFNDVSFNELRVSGTAMGYAMEELLTKSTNQTIPGQKRFQGSINATELFVGGLVNDVNLTELIDRQLKKREPLQVIETEIELQSNLRVVGNLTVKGAYEGAEMKNFYESYENVLPVAERMSRASEEAEIINTALRNRAVYITKLELVKDSIDASDKSTSDQTAQCKSTNFSPRCISGSLVNLDLKINTSDFVLLKSIVMDEEEFVVLIKFDSVSIYLFDNMENGLIHLKDLHIQRILDAFVEPQWHSLWIVLRLSSQTLVLLYQPWKDLQEYVLPVTDVFAISRPPNGQLLLLLSNGVWNLEGLSSPRNIIEIPLTGKTETFVAEYNYYVECTSGNGTALMKARYAGN